MSASSLVAETMWKEIESTSTGGYVCNMFFIPFQSLYFTFNWHQPFYFHISQWLMINFGSESIVSLHFFWVFSTHRLLLYLKFVSFGLKSKPSLHFLFGKNFEGATRIVDQRGVKRISGHPSGRFIFQVSLPHLSCFCIYPCFVFSPPPLNRFRIHFNWLKEWKLV